MTLAATLKRRGAAAVELAFLLPLVGFLFAVALDYCRAFYSSQAVQACADAAATLASGTAQASSVLDREEAARQAALASGADLNPPLRPDQVKVVFTPTTVAATIHYEHSLLTPLLSRDGKIQLVRTVSMALAPKIGD